VTIVIWPLSRRSLTDSCNAEPPAGKRDAAQPIPNVAHPPLRLGPASLESGIGGEEGEPKTTRPGAGTCLPCRASTLVVNAATAGPVDVEGRSHRLHEAGTGSCPREGLPGGGHEPSAFAEASTLSASKAGVGDRRHGVARAAKSAPGPLSLRLCSR
jgi:hypothetical protein